MIVLIVSQLWLERYKTVLTSNIYHVIDPPVHLPDSSCRMPKSLQGVHQHNSSTDTDPDTFDGLENRVDNMGTSLKDVGPDVVQKMNEGILAAKALNS